MSLWTSTVGLSGLAINPQIAPIPHWLRPFSNKNSYVNPKQKSKEAAAAATSTKSKKKRKQQQEEQVGGSDSSKQISDPVVYCAQGC